VIARIWRGVVRADDAAAYRAYVEETGLRQYRETPGNRGAWLLQRIEGDHCEIVTLSFWESLDAVRGFAGDDPERAVFYPEDDRFLVERDTRVSHYDVYEN
jgi:heme-degrading monooxygenase HmoA